MMDEGTKVWHPTFGIKTDALNVIKANILGTPTLHRDFDRCVTLFKSHISSNRNAKNININISETNTIVTQTGIGAAVAVEAAEAKAGEGAEMGAAVVAIEMA